MIREKNGLPFYTGTDKAKKLEELSDAANHYHHRAHGTGRLFLEYARRAGEALLEAKRIHGHRRKWTAWRAKNFHASRETACIYMRVAKHWDDPRLRDAWTSGVKLDSIRKVMEILRGKSTATPPKQPSETDTWRKWARQNFAELVREMSKPELEELCGGFSHYGPTFRKEVASNVHPELLERPMPPGWEEEKTRVRRRVHESLNSRAN